MDTHKRKRVEDDHDLDGEEEEHLDEETINRLLEQAPEIEPLDEQGVKKMVLSLERKITQNQMLRMKFSDKPEKFMASEIDLYEEVKGLEALSSNPHLYPLFVQLNAVISLLSLLSHENTDIAIGVVDLFNELTDADTVLETEEAMILVHTLIQHEGLELLVAHISRMDMDVSEENNSVFKALEIFENLIEIKPDTITLLTEKTKVLEWLLQAIQRRKFDDTKLYCSEILSILLTNQENQKKFPQIPDAVDILLRAIAVYKKQGGAVSAENEYIENLFDILCSILQIKETKDTFREAEGIELMLRILKSRVPHCGATIKVLTFALQDNTDNCTRFIEALGLKTLFPAFMNKVPSKKKLKKKNIKRSFDNDEDEEHIVSIIVSLLKHVRGEHYERLMSKFEESELEKVERLLELHIKYYGKVSEVNEEITQEIIQLEAEGESITDDIKEEFYLKKLDHGGFTLQLVDRIMAIIATDTKHPQIRSRLNELLNQRDRSLQEVVKVLQEYFDNIGTDTTEGKTERESVQKTILAIQQ